VARISALGHVQTPKYVRSTAAFFESGLGGPVPEIAQAFNIGSALATMD
jgi:hypothetical protein